jgi:hypothetical protein
VLVAGGRVSESPSIGYKPSKDVRLGVGAGEEAAGCCLQGNDGAEDATFRPQLGELGGEPLGGVQEPDESLVVMALHAAADDAAFQHIRGGEQRGGAVPDVVVGDGAAALFLQGQSGLGSIERVDLAFLVHGEDDGMGAAQSLTMLRNLAVNSRALDSLNWHGSCGCKPWARRMACVAPIETNPVDRADLNDDTCAHLQLTRLVGCFKFVKHLVPARENHIMRNSESEILD